VIGLVPLDDRPCNRLFPQQLAPIAGCDLLMPPRETLGWFTMPADCEALMAWLDDCSAQRLVVSLDMLCYGGLVAGRASATRLTQARTRLRSLHALKERRPELIVYASASLMRLGGTVTSAETLRLHSDLVAYSMLYDRLHRLGDGSARAELDGVTARLDADALQEYLAVRLRNHEVNRASLQLVADHALDYLIICQEDAAPVGLHIPEQQALRDDIARLGISDRVALHPGADEAGLVLMARQLADLADYAPRIAPDYATQAGAAAIPLYEYQPLRQSVESQLRAAGAEVVPPGRAHAIMFVHTPIGEQREAGDAPPQGQSPSYAMQADRMAARLQAARAAGYLAGIADVAYANGADPELVAALRRSEVVKDLNAFAGWNTASNTIGTVTAQLCLGVLAARAGISDPSPSARFLACRLLDDWAYQSCVRKRAAALAESQGENPYSLGAAAPRLEEYVRAELQPFAHDIHSFAWGGAEEGDVTFSVTLPWKRLFEIEADVSSPPS
jgi:hypothetical protein